MKDTRTLAFINLNAILGSIPKLCALVPEARQLITDENIRVGFAVKGGPSGTLCFANGVCTLEEGADKCDIKLPFSSPEKFNGMIDGTVTPIPSKGFTKIGFLTKKFMKLTDILSKYLKATEEDLKNSEFFKTSTLLVLNVIACAAAQVGNEDKVGKVSASNFVDGVAAVLIGNEYGAGLEAHGHRFKAITERPEKYTSFMKFESLEFARAIFDGKENAVASVGTGQLVVGGMISQVDNVNRILDRVSFYLKV